MTHGHGTPFFQSRFCLSTGDSASAGEHWIINPTGWEVGLGLGQGGPGRDEILAWAHGGSSLSRAPWGLYSGPSKAMTNRPGPQPGVEG